MATVGEKMTAIANAIRTKTGKTEKLTLDTMASSLNAIPERTSSNLTASGATVTVPAGNYKSQATKSVATATQATPSISVDSSGLITASATQTAGYVSAGTKSATKQLTTKAAATITPKTSNQTIAAGTYLTGKQTIAGDADLVAGNIKKGVKIFNVTGTYDAVTAALNFTVVGGTSTPSSPSENTVWVNTSQTITSWCFSPIEPNVYDIQPTSSTDPWNLISTHPLQEGDVLNFTIPANVTGTFEAIRIYDTYSQKIYCIRESTGAAVGSWTTGIKVAVRISNTVHTINSWGHNGSAYLIAWDAYSHNEGEVWIKTGKNSNVAFNALKSDAIQVYPNNCQQWSGGMWVSKTAKTYQYGSWVDWYKYIYNNGDFTSITGGWTATKWNGGSELTLTMTVDETGVMTFKSATTGGTGRMGYFYTNNAVDLTDYSKICWNITADSAPSGTTQNHQLFVFTNNSYTVKDAYVYITNATIGVYEIDISSLTGAYKIGACMTNHTGSTHSISFDSIWLE